MEQAQARGKVAMHSEPRTAKSNKMEVSLKVLLLKRLINNNFSEDENIPSVDKNLLEQYKNMDSHQRIDKLAKLEAEFYSL